MNSLTELLDIINARYQLTPIDTNAYNGLKVNGMKFDIKAYKAKGLGHVSIMSARGFFGLMKMDTLIINPTEVDLPLYSYDRILAMGNDTYILEVYDTMLEATDLSSMEALNSKYNHLPLHDLGAHWYDNIKLPCSISFKGKKQIYADLDKFTVENLKSFLALPQQPVADKEAKEQKSLYYVNGLLEHGGPSTDAFTKAIGPGATATLFHHALFGV